MKNMNVYRWSKIIIPCVALMLSTGCLGPNPLFFVTSSAVNASIMNLVNQFFNTVIFAG